LKEPPPSGACARREDNYGEYDMEFLILGLLVFLGMPSIYMLAPGWRSRQIARFGEGPWAGLFSVVSGTGMALIIWGFGLAQQHPVDKDPVKISR
jgi:uncharacterized membrane protein